MSLLFLNAHESRLVLQGKVWDPRYRPWHASDDPDLAIDWSALLDEDAEAGGNEWPATAAAGVPVDEPDAGSTDDGPAESDTAPPRPTSRLLVNVASRYWSSTSRRIVFLVGRDAGSQVLLGVGNCQTVGQRRAQGSTTVELTDWRVFAKSIDVDSALAQVSTANRHVVARVLLEEDARAFPEAARLAFDGAIRALVPDLDSIVADLPPFPSRRAPITASGLPSWDAQQSALRIFSAKWRALGPVADPEGPTPLASDLESYLLRSEDETTTDDTGAFLDWTPDGRSRGGWYEFRSDGRQLLVKNVNYTKKFETPTGADLVYVRSSPESVVLVQYKLLTSDKGSTDYFFRDDGRLGSQVQTMLEYSTPPLSSPGGQDDYRMSGDLGFVKFVEPTPPKDAFDSRGVPNGRYHPAEGVLRMLGRPSKGTAGGPVFRVGDWRSLSGETFVKLVRDQWVGSAGIETEKLLTILGLGTRTSLCLAVEQPVAPSPDQ